MGALFRKGDVVSVTGKIRHDQSADENLVFVDIDGYHSTIGLLAKNIALIAPRIDVGERVRWTNGKEGTVLASNAECLWVMIDAPHDLDDRSYVTWPAREVAIVPPQAITIAGPVDTETLERLKAEGPGNLVIGDAMPAPLDGKVGSEEALLDRIVASGTEAAKDMVGNVTPPAGHGFHTGGTLKASARTAPSAARDDLDEKRRGKA